MVENRIAQVIAPMWQGTGFLVGPNDLLTNAHVALSENGVSPDLTVQFESGQTANVTGVDFIDVSDTWDDGFIAYENTRYDLALLTLDEPIGEELGWFELAYGINWRPDELDTAGYPAETFSGEEQRSDTVEVRYDNSASAINFNSDQVEPGSSGSPVWFTGEDGTSYAVGVVASGDDDNNVNAALFTPTTYVTALSWIEGNDAPDPVEVDAAGSSFGLLPDYVRDVALLYEAGLDRDGDFDWEGLNYWIDAVLSGRSMLETARAFLKSEEFERKFGEALDASQEDYLSDAAFVDRLYLNVLDRPGEAQGREHWLGVLADGGDRAQVLASFALSEENANASPHIDTLTEVEPGYWAFG